MSGRPNVTPVSHLISQSPGDGILKKMSNMCYMCSIQHCIIPQIIFIGIKIGSGSHGLKLKTQGLSRSVNTVFVAPECAL